MIKKALLIISFIALIFSFMVRSHTYAESIPAPVGDIYVQDFANIITAKQKRELIDLGTYLEKHTGAQFAILTINSLENLTVKEYAEQAFRQYKLGSAKNNNGMLLLLALQERKLFIEVGTALEGTLPDSLVGKTLDSYALPFLEDNRIDLAITNTYKQLFNEVAKANKLDKRAKAQGFEYGYGKNKSTSPFFIIIITLVSIFGILFLDIRYLRGAIIKTIIRIVRSFTRGNGKGGNGQSGGNSSTGGVRRRW